MFLFCNQTTAPIKDAETLFLLKANIVKNESTIKCQKTWSNNLRPGDVHKPQDVADNVNQHLDNAGFPMQSAYPSGEGPSALGNEENHQRDSPISTSRVLEYSQNVAEKKRKLNSVQKRLCFEDHATMSNQEFQRLPSMSNAVTSSNGCQAENLPALKKHSTRVRHREVRSDTRNVCQRVSRRLRSLNAAPSAASSDVLPNEENCEPTSMSNSAESTNASQGRNEQPSAQQNTRMRRREASDNARNVRSRVQSKNLETRSKCVTRRVCSQNLDPTSTAGSGPSTQMATMLANQVLETPSTSGNQKAKQLPAEHSFMYEILSTWLLAET